MMPSAVMVIFAHRSVGTQRKGGRTQQIPREEIRPPGEEDTTRFLKSNGNQPR